jgi:hypothetical protein
MDPQELIKELHNIETVIVGKSQPIHPRPNQLSFVSTE